jgi:hypothetical protein
MPDLRFSWRIIAHFEAVQAFSSFLNRQERSCPPEGPARESRDEFA